MVFHVDGSSARNPIASKAYQNLIAYQNLKAPQNVGKKIFMRLVSILLGHICLVYIFSFSNSRPTEFISGELDLKHLLNSPIITSMIFQSIGFIRYIVLLPFKNIIIPIFIPKHWLHNTAVAYGIRNTFFGK